jgi:GT2 family glycosyltransferase
MEAAMTDDAAKILVVVPTLGDRLDFLKETLESVNAQRADVALTLVVVSPSDAYEARRMADSFGAVLVEDPRAGISAAINRGIAAATTEAYCSWLGDDDCFRPGGLLTLRSILDGDARAAVAYGGCDYIDPKGRILWVSAAGRLARFILPWGPNLIPNPAAMIRLDALRKTGGFDETLKLSMDLDMFLSLRRHGRLRSTRRVVAAFRWHPDSLTVANRTASSREAEAVRVRHLPGWLRPLAPVWHAPVRWASSIAASRVSARARE